MEKITKLDRAILLGIGRSQGVAWAAAELMRVHDRPMMAYDILRAWPVDWAVVDPKDLATLAPLRKELQREDQIHRAERKPKEAGR